MRTLAFLAVAASLTAAAPVFAADAPPGPVLNDTPQAKVGVLPPGLGLRVGDKAPDAEVLDLQGQPVKLAGLYAQGPVFLVFYRGGWCPFCNRQLHNLAAAKEQFDAKGLKLAAISVDRPSEEAKTQAKQGVPFPMLSDSKLAAHQAFKVVHQPGEQERGVRACRGRDLGERLHDRLRERLGELAHATPVRGGADHEVEPRVGRGLLHRLAVQRRRMLRERHHEHALRARLRERLQRLAWIRTEHPVRVADRQTEARLEARRELAIDGVERRTAADRLVATAHLGEQLGGRRVAAPDVRQELGQLVELVDRAMGDQQHRITARPAHPRADVLCT